MYLDNLELDKVYPNEENILEEVSDLEIFRYYIGNFKIGSPIISPLAKDTNPSFAIYTSRKYIGRLFFKDHRNRELTGSSIRFVQLLFNSTYKEAMERIIIDFKLEDIFIIDNPNLKQLKPVLFRLDKESRIEYKASKLDLKITSRGWKSHDIEFWKNSGINLSTLKLFNIVPIKYYWMYGKLFTADKYAYAYKEWKDGELNYKVYQPYRNTKNHKFLNGFLDGTFSGWGLLPKFTDLIIITKSTKDCMFLYEHNYYAIAPQGEGYTFKSKIIDLLKTKCNRLIQLYDHDNAGILSANRNRNDFDIPFVSTLDFNNKDITDYYKHYGLSETLELLEILFK